MSIGQEQLREVRLYGVLGKKYGRVHKLAVATVREAAQALGVIIPGFAKDVLEHKDGFHLFTGALKKEANVGERSLDCRLGRGEAICIAPAIAGAKQGGVLQVIVGAVLLVAGFFTGGATWGPAMMMLGGGLMIGGIIQMSMPSPDVASRGAESRAESYAFGSVANSTAQGVGVPVVYGRAICGSVVVSQGLTAVEMAV